MENDYNNQSELNQEKSQESFQIEDLSSLHKYRTETPNIILDMELDPFEYSLYSHIKRIAGDGGRCIASNKYLARKTCMSIDKVKRVKKILVEKNLIRMTVRKNKDNSFQTTLVQIIDWWPRNFQYFAAKKEEREAKLKEFLIGAEKAEGVGAEKADLGFVNTQEEEPLEEEPINKKVAPSDAPFLSMYLLEKLKELRPDRAIPNLKQWNKDFESLMRIKKLSKEAVIVLIDFVTDISNTFKVESPASLGKKYENIADHMVIEKKTKEVKSKAKKDPRVAKTVQIINDYLKHITAGDLPNTLSFVVNADGSVYHTVEKRHYPRSYDGFIDALKGKNVPESLLSRIKSGVN